MTQLTASDGHTFDTYEVHPEGATGSVVIVQEIFGVTEHIRDMVDRYAAMGFRAITPALFDRVQPGVDLPYTRDAANEGKEIRDQIDWDDSLLDIAAAVDHVGSTGPVAVVGYCYGGSIAWLSAHSLPIAAAVGYYGGRIHLFRGKEPKVPVQLHFAALDQHIPLESVAEVVSMHPDLEVHVYDDADHGFNCEARKTYHAPSADLAGGRSLRFITDSFAAASGERDQ